MAKPDLRRVGGGRGTANRPAAMRARVIFESAIGASPVPARGRSGTVASPRHAPGFRGREKKPAASHPLNLECAV